MELMNYNRIGNNKSNTSVVMLLLFIILGSGIVVYGIMNEPKPKVLGENALVEVNSIYTENAIEKKDIAYNITSILRTEKKTNYQASITVPQLEVDGVLLTDINNEIKQRFYTKYDDLSVQGENSLENTFLYKVKFQKYESEINNQKILSIVFTETITAKDNQTFSDKQYAYVINLNDRKILTQDDIGAMILGYNYRNILKSNIKVTVIQNGLMTEDNYSYSLTGIEECYVKDSVIHVIFNSGSNFDKLTKVLDIEVNDIDK